MIGKIRTNATTVIKKPSVLPLYAKWMAAGLFARQRVMAIDTMRVSGFPSFSSYLGAWRNRPSAAERAYFETCVNRGATAFDVGANYGMMAMTMARLCGPSGRVFAFEPIPDTFASLTSNLRRNGFEWVRCAEYAVGAQPGTVGFTNSSDPATNRISADHDLIVDLDTLDGICDREGIDRIEFLKIDVEGAELDVLTGARSLLERHAIRAGMIEICPGTLSRFGTTPEHIYDTFSEYNYTLSWIEAPDVYLKRETFRNLPVNFLGNAAFQAGPHTSST